MIPVYRGESTLEQVVTELLPFTESTGTSNGLRFRILEILLVHDNGPDASDEKIRLLSETLAPVRAIWLSRNFGQHAATIAGIASSNGDWVATLDEDGQHDPADLGAFLDIAVQDRAHVVYGRATNVPPHGRARNWASRSAKRIVNRVLLSSDASQFSSYRLILGSIGRGMAATAGPGVYLDVALGWVTDRYATAPTLLRGEQRASGYSTRRLLSHFWRLVLSSGTRALRLVSALGIVLGIVGITAATWIIIAKLTMGIEAEGWASTVVILLLTAGAVLFSLGIIAEYLGISVDRAMGKPAFLIISDSDPSIRRDPEPPTASTQPRAGRAGE